MRWILLAGFALAPEVMAQRPAAIPTAVEAQHLEAGLKANPGNAAARASLLAYYFATGSANPAVAIPARRKHLLWMIENAPADVSLVGSPATIDASGHALADATGFQQASAAWRQQVEKADVAAQALVNAAMFFKLSDKSLTIRLLERVVAAEPANKEFGARLGDQYVLAIMGVTRINRSGFPLGTDPMQIRSEAAVQARQALTETCRSPYALAKAGYQLGWQGAILRQTRKIDFDPAPLAKTALERAVQLAPGEADVARYLAEFNKLPGQSVRAVEAAAVTSPVVTVDVAGAVRAGMSRDEVVRALGQPAGKITSTGDDGAMVESLQYYGPGGKWAGTVRLTAGVVTKVDAPAVR
jgi:hypothetical protein